MLNGKRRFTFEEVTPFAGVWIEIEVQRMQPKKILSLPSRECGLKCPSPTIRAKRYPSLPSRECGLKLMNGCLPMKATVVTPFAGVWIEIKRE